MHHNARVFTPDDKAMQTPNSDTPYSFIGADLRAEPLVLTVPAVEKQRYYSLQFIDPYTYNFAYVGSRATGNDAGNFLLAGPELEGRDARGIKSVIRSETELAFVFFRTQLFDPADIDNVKKIQAGYKVQPLSPFLGKPAPPRRPTIDFIEPLTPEQQKTSLEFFHILNFVLQFCPTNPSETELMARFGKLGIGAGQAVRRRRAFARTSSRPSRRAWPMPGRVRRLQGESHRYGQAVQRRRVRHARVSEERLLCRMSGAVLGIYGNSKEEAMYPAYFIDSAGQKLDGSQQLHASVHAGPVAAGQRVLVADHVRTALEPADRQCAQSLPDQFADAANLKRDADGGITLYVQHESPGKNRNRTGFPLPRVRSSRDAAVLAEARALDGQWKAPPLEPVQ